MTPPGDATILLLRHGRTALNARELLRGHIDEPLDEVGRAEAEALGAELSTLPLAAIVSSPLSRALDTARAVAAHHDIEVEIDPDLVDRDWGTWAGRSRDELVAAHGSADGAPDVEATATFEDRVEGAFARAAQRALEAGAAGAVVLVAHDVVNRTILARLTGDRAETVPQRTGCWNRIEHTASGWTPTVIDAKPPGDPSRRCSM